MTQTIITIPATSLAIDDTASNDTITVADGPPENGYQTTQVTEANPSITSIFANQTAVTITGSNDGSDNVLLDNPDPASGLQSLTVSGMTTINGSNPNANSPDIAVAALNLNGVSIGANRALRTQVSTLVAAAGSGSGSQSINIENGVAAPVTLNIAGAGLQADAGSITLTNNGAINDTGSIFAVGAVNITTTGSTAGLNTGSGSGITAVDGAVNLTVGGDINLGDGVGSGNISATSGVTATAGGNITLNANATVTNSTGGNVTLSAGGNLTMLTSPGTPGSAPEIVNQANGGTIQLSAGKGHTLTVDSSGATAISSLGGNITLIADAMVINKAINATTNNTVTLETTTPGQAINLGAANAPGVLGLTQAELNQITASEVQIGSNAAGNITIASPITNLLHSSTLELQTGGNISEATFGSLTIPDLLLVVPAGAATLTNPNNNIGIIAGQANNGLTVVNGTHTLTVGAVNGTPGFVGFVTLNGPINLTADNLSISSAINAGSGIVTLAPYTATLNVTLGTASVANTSFGLTDTELGQITASVLRVDTGASGNLSVSAAIARHTGFSTLSLASGGSSAISQTASLAVANLALYAINGINLTNSSNSVDVLSFANLNGAVSFTNTGTNGLTIGAVDGIASSSNSGTTTTISTGGNLTFDVGLSSIGATTLTSTNGQILDGANDTIVDVTAPSLALSASTGIGTSADPLETQVSTLSATTAAGGIFISNGETANAAPATLMIGIGSTGIGVTGASGNIMLLNNGTIDSTIAGDTITAPGSITIQALGANSDINLSGQTTAFAVRSTTSGTVDIEAGRDLNLGGSTAGSNAPISSSGSVVLKAGRNLTINPNAYVQTLGTGTLTASAGGNFTMLTTPGTLGDEFFTNSGAIALSAGAGATMTLASSGTTPAVQSGSNITLTADNLAINSKVIAHNGTGNVLIQPVTAGQQINLGTATGDLALSDVALSEVIAKTLTIGNASAGQVTVAGTIGPGGVAAINLTSGGSGYATVPTVTITGGGGTGATAVAMITGGVITGVQVTAQGQGYTSTPTIAFSGGGGTGAAGTAVPTSPLGATNLTINTGSNFTATGAALTVAGTLTIDFGENGLGDTANLSGATIAAATIDVNGGAGNDTFVTGTANETITGGGGVDTVDFSGTRAQYGISTAANGVVTVANASSTYTLSGISVLSFADTTVALAPPAPVSAASLRYVGTGRSGAASSTLVWQNSNGTPTLWTLSGASAAVTLEPYPGPGVQLVAVGDLLSHGAADLLFQNSSGAPEVWEMNGTTVANGLMLPNPGPGWTIDAAGDAFDTGFDNTILLQNTSDLPVLWEMNGATITNDVALPDPGPNWTMLGTGDFFHTGFNNTILWQNTSDLPVLWQMNGGTIVNDVALPNPGPGWSIRAEGNFFGDGHDDSILWQNTGDLPVLWQMNGATIVNNVALPNPGPGWTILGAGAVTGNGLYDIFWQSTGGQNVEWSMNGSQLLSANTLTSNSLTLDAPNTAATGSGTELIAFNSTNQTFIDGPGFYTDTVVGFSQPQGDRIHLTTDTLADALAHTTLVDGGQDTQILLSDGSAILLKGITSINSSFFV